MERALCGIQKKPRRFWVNIKSKGTQSPSLAPGGGAAARPCLLGPTATAPQRPEPRCRCRAPWCDGCCLRGQQRAGGEEGDPGSFPGPHPALPQAPALSPPLPSQSLPPGLEGALLCSPCVCVHTCVNACGRVSV